MGTAALVAAGAVVGSVIGAIGNAFSKPKTTTLINDYTTNNYTTNNYTTNNYTTNNYTINKYTINNNYMPCKMPCCALGCPNAGQLKDYYHQCGERLEIYISQARLRCRSCQLQRSMLDFEFQCQGHAKKKTQTQQILRALGILGQNPYYAQNVRSAIRKLVRMEY